MRNRGWSAIVVLVLLLTPLAALAESGTVGTLLPPNPAGLQVAVDTVGLTGPGYRRLVVRVVDGSPAPATADRTIAIAFHQGWGDDEDSTAMTRASFLLAAGARSANHEVWLPRFNRSENLSWTVSVDGKPHRDMTGNAYLPTGQSNRRLLLVGEDTTPWSDTAGLVEIAQFMPRYSSGTANNGGDSWQIKAADLPREWRGYSTSEFIAMPIAELRQVARDPEALKVLELAVVAGADLCVFDIDDDFQGLEEIDRLLPPMDAKGWRPYGQVAEERHLAEKDEKGRRVSVDELRQRQYRNPQAGVWPEIASLDDDNRLRLRPHGMGQILAVASARPFITPDPNRKKGDAKFDPAKQHQPYLVNMVGPTLSAVQQTEGIVPARSLPIPGIGEPPVILFAILITLFAIVIGPLNYFLLLRAGRLWLVIVTVPAAALVVIFGLLGYAWLSNGSANYARSESYTWLDQPRGLAVAQADVAYFAGSPPAGGLVFPSDMLLLPAFESETPPGNRTQRRDTEFHWETGGQRLGTGFLPARSMARLFQKRVLTEVRQVGILVQEIEGGMAVTNKLGVPILDLILVDLENRAWRGKNIAVGKSAVLSPDHPNNFHELEQRGMEGNRSGWRHSYYGYSESLPLRAAILPRWESLQHATPGGFLVEVESNPFLPLGAEGIEERGSKHLIFGRWK